MAEQINKFISGMDQDSAKSVRKGDTYLNARNWRIVTDDDGESKGALESILGNTELKEIPGTKSSIVITVPEATSFPTVAEPFVIQTDNPVPFSQPCSIPIVNDGASLLDEIQSAFETEPLFIAEGFVVVRFEDRLYISQDPTDPNSNNITAINGTIPSGSPVYLNGDFVSIEYSAPQDDLIVIGSTLIRDTIILFTTNDTTTSGGPGQIWSFTYDKSNTSTQTFELLYSSPSLFFSTEYPIEALGRFENGDTQRVYWTDFFNSVRTFNTKNEKLLSVSIDNINIVPSVDLEKPIVTDIGSGDLFTGVYQYSYRLKNVGGIQTEFSRMSNPISICADSLRDDYNDYDGDGNTGENSSKSIIVTIDEIDNDFAVIEIAAIYKENNLGSSVYKISLIKEENLQGENTFTFEHTGSEEGVLDVTISEFLINSQSQVEIAKTLSTKDNRLFLGNVKESSFIIDFDARAFRFKKTTDNSYLDDSGATITYANVTGGNIDLEDDSINPYNKDSTREAESADQFKYKANSETADVLGGTGQFVSYKFKVRSIDLDNVGYPIVNESHLTKGVHSAGTQYVNPGNNATTETMPDLALSSGIRTFNTGLDEGVTPLWKNYKNPLYDSLFRGYQRGEVYRFGIVFFNKKGIASNVNWIGDIRFPDHYDSDSINSSYKISSYSIPNLTGKILGIEFDVDLTNGLSTSDKEKVSGFSIVRVKRDISDRTLLGQGMLNELLFIEGTNKLGAPSGLEDDFYCNLDRAGNGIDDINVMNVHLNDGNDIPRVVDGVCTIDMIQHRFEGFPDMNLLGYKLKPIHVFRERGGEFINRNYQSVDKNGGTSIGREDFPAPPTSGDDHVRYVKLYGNPYIFTDDIAIDNIEANSLVVIKAKAIISGDKLDSLSEVVPSGQVFHTQFKKNIPANPNPDDILYGTPALINTDKPYYNAARSSGIERDSTFTSIGESTIIVNTDINDFKNLVTKELPLTTPPFNTVEQSGIRYSQNTPDPLSVPTMTLKMMLNLYRELAKQYGGGSFTERTLSEYISCGDYQKISDGSQIDSIGTFEREVWGGDIFIVDQNYQKHYPAHGAIIPQSTKDLDNKYLGAGTDIKRGVAFFYPVESTVNIELRKNEHFSIVGTSSINAAGTDNPADVTVRENYDHNSVYSQDRKLRTYFSNPINFITNIEFDNRIVSSEVKTNGELSDQWRVFLSANTIDVEGIYGGINKLEVLRDQMFYLQDSAFGRININPRVTLSSTEGSEVELGTGDVLQDFDYISTEYGTRHQKSVVKSNTSLYFFDASKSKIIKFQGQGAQSISDVYGMSSFIAKNAIGDIKEGKDNPLQDKGVHGYYDYRFQEIVYTFLNDNANFRATIAYNEMANAFTSFYDFHPRIYIVDKFGIISPNKDDENKLYIHNTGSYTEFYGIKFKLILDIEMSSFPNITKVFDNIGFHLEVVDASGATDIVLSNETITKARFHNDYQNSDYITPDQTAFTGNIRQKEREWQMPVARNAVTTANADIFLPANIDQARQFKDRMRDKYITMNFEFDNQNDRKVIWHYLKTYFRQSAR